MGAYVVPLGAGLYWSSIMTSMPAAAETRTATVVAFCVVVAAVVAAPYLTWRNTLPIAFGALALGMLDMLGQLGPIMDWFSSDGPFGNLCEDVGSVASPLLMLLWGARFASLPRSEAFLEVCRTTAAALAFTLACTALADGYGASLREPLCALLQLVSAAVFTLQQASHPLVAKARDRNPSARPQFTRFIATRLLYGVCLGYIQAASFAGMGTVQAASWPVLLLAVAVCITLFLKVPDTDQAQTLLPTLPCAAALGLTALAGPFPTLSVPMLWAGLWLSWIAMSSVELSELKHVFGMGEFALAFGEKAAVVGGILAGSVLGTLTRNVGIADDIEAQLFVIATIVGGVYSSARLASLARKRDRESAIEQASASKGRVMQCVLDRVSEDFGLSAREEEILSHVADGHTRAYISNRMDIAPGTVKAHVSHLYTKMGCHTREEAMAIVERYAREARGQVD